MWKTLGLDPPVVNVKFALRRGVLERQRMAGLNNIELISDRPLRVNLDEIRQVKRDWPDRAMIVSLMVPCDEQSWNPSCRWSRTPAPTRSELNFGCPHGMSERGMETGRARCPNTSRWWRAG